MGMVKETMIRPIGNSAGVTIPKAMLEQFNMQEGDTVHIVETRDGVLITPYDPGFQRAMEVFHEGMRQYRNAMRELADQ